MPETTPFNLLAWGAGLAASAVILRLLAGFFHHHRDAGWIQASHLGQWDFCHKQYHLQHILGWEPSWEAMSRMAEGTRKHAEHGSAMHRSRRLARTFHLFLAAATILVAWILLSGFRFPTDQIALPKPPPAVWLLTLALIAFALLARARANTIAAGTGLPSRAQILASDVRQGKQEHLRDPELRLAGTPDYVLRERTGWFRSRRVSAELKPRRKDARPLDGHRLQLLAYIWLMLRKYGNRAAPYGYLTYGEDPHTKTFRIDLDPANQAFLLNTVRDIQAVQNLPVVPRNHTSYRRCAACGFRANCPDSLA